MTHALATATQDLAHTSSHWQEWGAKRAGFGTQRRLSPADLYGVPALAMTSSDRAWVFSRLPRAIAMSRRMGLAFTQDSIRQLCTLALLRKHFTPGTHRILVIGDGFGVFSGLVRTEFPTIRVHLVDLSFTLEEQRRRLTAAFGPRAHFTFTHAGDIHHWLSWRFDIAVNIASMQEMDPAEVQRYFAFMRGRVKLFYCCNRESKTLPDGTVSAFAEYPWSESDDVMLDELCPWHQWYLSFRLPLFRRYDGPIQHRLVRLAP